MAREQMPRKWTGKRGEVDRNCEGRLHRKISRKSGRRMEKEQQIERTGDC